MSRLANPKQSDGTNGCVQERGCRGVVWNAVAVVVHSHEFLPVREDSVDDQCGRVREGQATVSSGGTREKEERGADMGKEESDGWNWKRVEPTRQPDWHDRCERRWMQGGYAHCGLQSLQQLEGVESG